jgi:glyoxylase-like metal-dependent hydrolase (beta-lactamase superfamily II)
MEMLKTTPVKAIDTNQNLYDVLQERGIIVFSQNITLVKKNQFGKRFIRIRLDIIDCRKQFTIFLNEEKTPVMVINHLNQFQEAYQQIRDKIKPEEVLSIQEMLRELDEKKLKFSIPHSYYFSIGETAYLIDSSTSKKRALNIKSHLHSTAKPFHILSSHYHPDHWANNVLLANRNTRIYVHHAAREIFMPGYHVLMYTYLAKFFKTVDVVDVIRRTFRLSRRMLGLAAFFIRKTPILAILVFQAYNMKFVERFRSGKKHFYYLDKDDQVVFEDINMSGWKITDGLIALETPGHSYDHLAFYIPDRKTLFTGEIDVFLNPVSIIDCPQPLIHATIDQVIQLVITENIDLLLPSHYLPISGNQKIVEHLTEQKEKLQHCYQSICNIILEQTSWEWRKLMQAVYQSSDQIIQEAIRLNWPKTISNLDIYVAFVLQELGYVMVDPSTKTWRISK